MAELSTIKLPLPKFLQILTGNGVPAAKAMAVTGKMLVCSSAIGPIMKFTPFEQIQDIQYPGHARGIDRLQAQISRR